MAPFPTPMNSYQKLWWEQARSDHKALAVVLRDGMAPCHALHYLQMATEKLAKAYLWRSGSPPPKSHAGFAKFLRLLGSTGKRHRQRVAKAFSFRRFADFQNWINAVIPIANELENLAPSLANDGPNPEYPWPHSRPHSAPVYHDFAVWATLASGRGRDLMRVIHIAVERFPEYADL